MNDHEDPTGPESPADRTAAGPSPPDAGSPPAGAGRSHPSHEARGRYAEHELAAMRERCDLAALVRAQGVELKQVGRDLKGLCPFHAEKTPSFHVNAEARYWKCFGCGAGGDAFRFLMQAEGLDFRAAVARVAAFAGMDPERRGTWKPSRPIARPAPRTIEEPPVPTPDAERLAAYCKRAAATYQGSPELQAKWGAKRGIRLETAAAYGLGFMPWSRFKGWSRSLPNAWVLPIADAAGEVRAVKLHREAPPPSATKTLWAPFGTQPAEKPRHAFVTLWPAPEWFDPRARIFVTEGELKALAILSAGYEACSVTAGSSHRWTPASIARVAGRRVVLVYDDDDAGRKFLGKSIEALRGAVAELKVKTFRRRKEAAA